MPVTRRPNHVMILRHNRVGLSSYGDPGVSWYYRITRSGHPYMGWSALRSWMNRNTPFTPSQVTLAAEYFQHSIGPVT